MSFVQGNQESGLTPYYNMTLGELVNKDADGDGIIDWEEPLYGLDPTKKETTPGIPDSTVINKLKESNTGEINKGIASVENIAINKLSTEGGSASGGGQTELNTENLTQTEKFSRELFATVAATSQSGVIDQATIDALGASLSEKIENPVVGKVFSVSDIKIINDDSLQAVKNYLNAMSKIEAKYPIEENATKVLQKFMADENTVNISALAELDLIIKPLQSMMDEVSKTNVPQSLALLHLDFLNGLERVIENLNDIKMLETDPIVAMGGISQCSQNVASLESAILKLKNAVIQKLMN